MRNNKKSSCDRVKHQAVGLDCFGQRFNFRLPDGRKDKRSWQGMILSIFVSVAIVFYASVKFIKLYGFDDNTIMISSRDSYFGTDFEFR